MQVVSKSAFSMIELIFAIVIIGISVISLPMVTQATAKGVEGNLVQEAIFAASTELNQVLSYQWDENAMDGSNLLSKVVWTNATDCNSTTKLRAGHINQPLHRKCIDNEVLRPTIAIDGTLNDIDDTIKTTPVSIFTEVSGTSSGYKKEYSSSISVEYADFGATTAASQNMKKVTVSITDSDAKVITLLKTYSANIGEIDYYKRSYQ
ncbi:MAG: hypothetical protein NTW78_13115 [Campylobacterales bacterium]|nr:hypothetical protein [Campylobacterales bacterium]